MKKDINITENSYLKKLFKIKLNDGNFIGFTDNSEDIFYNELNYTASNGFDSNNENFYSDLTYGNSNIFGLVSNDIFNLEEILNGKFDNAEIEIFFLDLNNNNKKIEITKGYITSIKLIDGKIFFDISNILYILDKNIGEIYSSTCRAKFCDSKCSLNPDLYTFYGSVKKIKDDFEFSCYGDSIINKKENYFKYGIITFIDGLNSGKSVDVKYSTTDVIVIGSKFSKEIKIGDNFKIIAGCDKNFNTCCNVFNNDINFRGEPFISTTTKMYKFY